MIIDQIKKENLLALKEKNKAKRAIYSVLINRYQIENIEKLASKKEMKDEDTIHIIQKLMKELDEELLGYQKVNNMEEVDNIIKQKEALKPYLPKQLSDEEIAEIIEGLDDKSIGNVMKYFKENHAGECDMGRLAKSQEQLSNRTCRGQ